MRMDPTELLDPLELQENKDFLEYPVARARLEILERKVHQGRLVSLGRLVYLVPRVAMEGQVLLDQRDLREIRVTKVKKVNLALQVFQVLKVQKVKVLRVGHHN